MYNGGDIEGERGRREEKEREDKTKIEEGGGTRGS